MHQKLAPKHQNPIHALTIAALLVFPSACGVPEQNDVVYEIMEATGGVVGKVVLLKTSKAITSLSLDNAAEGWQGYGWQNGDATACKAVAPDTWSNVKAYEFPSAIIEAKSDQSYHLRICATQLNDPKAIAAIALVVSSQKVEPYKPT